MAKLFVMLEELRQWASSDGGSIWHGVQFELRLFGWWDGGEVGMAGSWGLLRRLTS